MLAFYSCLYCTIIKQATQASQWGGREKIMSHMTDEEYDALDIVAKNYIITKAEAFHKTPSEIIGEMVREKIAVNL